MLPLFFMESCLIWAIFDQSKKIFFYKTTDQKSFIFGLEILRGLSFWFVQIRSLWPMFMILSNDFCLTHFQLPLSNRCTDFHEIWLICASKKGFSNLFKSMLYDLFPLNYGDELLGNHVTCILFTLYYYMSPFDIPFLTTLKPRDRFASNFVWMFLGRIMGNFVQYITTQLLVCPCLNPYGCLHECIDFYPYRYKTTVSSATEKISIRLCAQERTWGVLIGCY